MMLCKYKNQLLIQKLKPFFNVHVLQLLDVNVIMPSSVINYFTYNEKSNTLKIIFVTGMVYSYQHVPKNIFEMLKIAESKGTFFNHYIKDKFKFKKLEE